MSQLTKDSTDAWKAWAEYSQKRFGNKHYGSVAWFDAYEAFTVEFLMQRGWRRIPGSTEWV